MISDIYVNNDLLVFVNTVLLKMTKNTSHCSFEIKLNKLKETNFIF